MKQLEAVIDKDEYDLSNFEEKILKREELLSKNNQQKNEEPEVNQSDEKLLYSEASTTNKVKSDKNLGNRPAWGSNTLHNKKNKVRESYKQSKTINSKNINNKVEEKKKEKFKFKKTKRKNKAKT